MRYLLVAGLFLAVLSAPAFAQFVYPGAEEQASVGLFYLNETRPMWLLDVDEDDIALPDDQLGDRNLEPTLQEVGLSFLIPGQFMSGHFGVSYVMFEDYFERAYDYGIGVNFGLNTTFLRIPLGDKVPPPDHMHADTDGAWPVAPYLFFGMGISIHAWYTHWEDNPSPTEFTDLDHYGGEISAIFFVGAEVVDGVSLWIYPMATVAYAVTDGIDTGTDTERLMEEDNVPGFGFGLNWRPVLWVPELNLLLEGRFLSQSSITFIVSYVFA